MEARAENDAGAIRQTGERLEILGDRKKVISVWERKPESEIGTEDSTELFNAEFGYGDWHVELR